MDASLLQEVLDATQVHGQVKRLPWGQIRPLCAGVDDAHRMHNFMRWLAERGRTVTVPDLAGPDGLSDSVLVSISRV